MSQSQKRRTSPEQGGPESDWENQQLGEKHAGNLFSVAACHNAGGRLPRDRDYAFPSLRSLAVLERSSPGTWSGVDWQFICELFSETGASLLGSPRFTTVNRLFGGDFVFPQAKLPAPCHPPIPPAKGMTV